MIARGFVSDLERAMGFEPAPENNDVRFVMKMTAESHSEYLLKDAG